jgi:hypothetical protein
MINFTQRGLRAHALGGGLRALRCGAERITAMSAPLHWQLGEEGEPQRNISPRPASPPGSMYHDQPLQAEPDPLRELVRIRGELERLRAPLRNLKARRDQPAETRQFLDEVHPT